LCQRRFADNNLPAKRAVGSQDLQPAAHALKVDWGVMGLAACIAAAVVFVWQEQQEYSFPPLHLIVACWGIRGG